MENVTHPFEVADAVLERKDLNLVWDHSGEASGREVRSDSAVSVCEVFDVVPNRSPPAAERASMSDLLNLAVGAHGGWQRWSEARRSGVHPIQ